MIRPDDVDMPFVARWNSMMRILLVETSVKHVGRAVGDYADFRDGTRCHPSNERLARETGYNERTVRTAWGVLRGLGLAERVGHGTAHLRRADEYRLSIPEGWMDKPVLGPHGGKFTCLYCDRAFNPRGNCTVQHEDGRPDTVRYDVREFVFCPAPRTNKGRPGEWCFTAWNREREQADQRLWGDLGQDVWKLFRQARDDDW